MKVLAGVELSMQVLRHSTTVNDLNSYDHGPRHWSSVFEHGMVLAKRVDRVDMLVLALFALFHDSMRENEHEDPEHGQRGWELACELGAPDHLEDFQTLQLQEACVQHDRGEVSLSPTIGVCWDADRLDLPRVGIKPDPALLSTDAARDRAEYLRGMVL